ncbi:MAG: SIS domain-containing protein [Steroidobacteraceae bacterium]
MKPVSDSPDVDVQALLQRELQQHREAFEATAQSLSTPFPAGLRLIESAIRGGGKILLFGNGASAADAQQIAAELAIGSETAHAPISAIALTTDTSALAACGNHFGFEAIFERQIAALGRPHDVALGISASGNCPNVLRGLRQANAMGLQTLGLTGGSGGQLHVLCDVLIIVPATAMARIQEMHVMIGHMLCKALGMRLGPVV